MLQRRLLSPPRNAQSCPQRRGTHSFLGKSRNLIPDSELRQQTLSVMMANSCSVNAINIHLQNGRPFLSRKVLCDSTYVPVEWVHGYSTQVLQNFSIDQEASTVLTPGRVNTFTAACHKLAGIDAYLHCSTIEPDVPTTPPESEALTCSFIELWILTTDQHLREGPVGSDAVEAVLIGNASRPSSFYISSHVSLFLSFLFLHIDTPHRLPDLQLRPVYSTPAALRLVFNPICNSFSYRC
ncbi:hypothetical protein KC363_g221 [Hortaea werneckii]|nr:hypothetical protein KC363_g221 [Hortaea werneckii]